MKPKESIRLYCLEFCSLGLKEEVRNCTNKMCPLWNYRQKKEEKTKLQSWACKNIPSVAREGGKFKRNNNN